MDRFVHIQVKDAAEMSQLKRLEAAFTYITDHAIETLQNELELAQVMEDEAKKKLYHIQIGMFRHAQAIFHHAKLYAVDPEWPK